MHKLVKNSKIYLTWSITIESFEHNEKKKNEMKFFVDFWKSSSKVTHLKKSFLNALGIFWDIY